MADAEASTVINAAPERVWGMITDVTRMGEWSPETWRAEWLNGSAAALGGEFRGDNRRGPFKWSTSCRITAFDAPRKFAFSTDAGTVWAYTLDSAGTGTRITESYTLGWPAGPMGVLGRIIGGGVVMPLLGRHRQLHRGMMDTLRRLKDVAESGG
jgi:uncharacterized protein YndB with AHSA1/START domain